MATCEKTGTTNSITVLYSVRIFHINNELCKQTSIAKYLVKWSNKTIINYYN